MDNKLSLREMIETDRPLNGVSCTFPSPQLVEIFCSAGAEFVFIDTEHTLIDRAMLASMLQAAEIWRIPVVARAAWNAPDLIGWPLDFGAEGIAVPMISTAQDAERFVHASRYAPAGDRSYGGGTPLVFRSSGFNATEANHRTICMAMIETREAVENIDAITRVDGLDAIFVGQSDLEIAYGLRPSIDRENPGHLGRMRLIADTAKRNGKALFVVCDKPEAFPGLVEMGYRGFMRSDVGIIGSAAKQAFKN